MRRRYLLLLSAFAVVGGCENAIAPEARWLIGTWRLAYTVNDYVPDPSAPDAPNAFVVTLSADAEALVREYGVVTLSTHFRAVRGTETDVGAIDLQFEAQVGSSAHYHIRQAPADSLRLENAACQVDHCDRFFVFARTP